MSLPQTGTDNWGVPLNAYIQNVVQAEADLAERTITTHQTANDPHGDRAYAVSLVTPITSGVNQPNGYVKLGTNGRLSPTVMPTGAGLTSIYDVVADYSAPVATTLAGVVDCSTQIQTAATDCANGGGGEVWLGAGYYGIGTAIALGAGTWFHLAPGATLVRVISSSSGTAPAALVTNFTTTSKSGAGNILIEGGVWDFTAQSLPAGMPVVLADASQCEIRNARFEILSGGNAVLLASMSYVTIHDSFYVSGSANYSGPLVVSQQTLSSATGYTFPATLSSTTACAEIYVEALDSWHTMAAFSKGYSHGTTPPPSYTLNVDGTVSFAGVCNVAPGTSGMTNEMVPEFGNSGYFPATIKKFTCPSNGADAYVELTINPSGELQVSGGDSAGTKAFAFTIDNVRFPLDI